MTFPTHRQATAASIPPECWSPTNVPPNLQDFDAISFRAFRTSAKLSASTLFKHTTMDWSPPLIPGRLDTGISMKRVCWESARTVAITIPSL
mmetsp:Transcript_7351/g.8495  ORF Transcript_7351/g.8495 Transcript_7351/m.8495 type:complete len:92 (-) Transcript_7351:387-662(-)